jgi:hypothetical protein
MSSLKPLGRIIFIAGLFFLLTIAAFFIWWHLPVKITRHSDIEFGNQLIKKIDDYKKQHELPETNDWQRLKILGFKDKGDFFVPDYQKINDTTYELTYVEGFDGPYLHWNSNDRRWKKAMPTLSADNTEEKVLNLVEKQKIVKDEIKLIDSLSAGLRHITLLPTLEDTVKNIYLIKVGEDNGTNLVTYFNFFVDANTMTILNPTGKLEGQ